MPPKRRPRAEMTPDPVSVDTLSASQEALPEAKKPKLVVEEPVVSVAPVVAVAKAAANSAIIDDGEVVEAPKAKMIVSAPSLPKSAEELNPDLIDDGRDVCRWDDECTRKNPVHFKEYRHPKLFEMRLEEKKARNGASNGYHAHTTTAAAYTGAPAMRRASSSGLGLTSAEVSKTTVRPEIELYKTVMKSVLGGSVKVSSEGRKLLKAFRQDHGITEVEHDQLLGQYGWTPDEYEDGEKSVSQYELEEERDFLRATAAAGQHDAFKIFTIFKHQKKSEQQEAVWARAASKFYQTMSKAQANFVIKSIGVIVNAKVSQEYETKKAALLAEIKAAPPKVVGSGAKKTAALPPTSVAEEWGFHGTSEASIQGISATGFKMPADLKKLQTAKKGGAKKGAAAPKEEKVTFLDDGFFGAGLYFSLYSDYALFYSEERGSSQILLCKVLTGRAFKCTDRMDGEGLQKGYDSHYSPQGNEIIVFRGDQVLPRYIITFEQRDAVEREQED